MSVMSATHERQNFTAATKALQQTLCSPESSEVHLLTGSVLYSDSAGTLDPYDTEPL